MPTWNIGGCGPKGNQRVPPTRGEYGRPEKKNEPKRDQLEAERSLQVPQGQVQCLWGRDDRKGSQIESRRRPDLPASGLGGQARQNHSHRLMERGMALKSIKIICVHQTGEGRSELSACNPRLIKKYATDSGDIEGEKNEVRRDRI